MRPLVLALDHTREYIAVALEPHPNDAWVQSSTPDLEVVLSNLISNAIKFSPRGSTLTLALNGSSWTVEVRDQGPGIPEHERETVFEKFRQGSNAATAGERSSGLGLFNVKNLEPRIRAVVEYRPGDPLGSVFAIRFDEPAQPR